MSEITRNQAIQIVEDIRTAISAGSVTNTMEAQVLEYCVSVLGRRIVEASLSGRIENLPDVAAFLAGISPSATLKALLEGITDAVENINANIGNGYVYAGIATPSGTPVSGKVFYLAKQAGQYANFGGLTVTEGVNILKRNGSTWTQEQLLSMADIYKNPLIGYYECDTAGDTSAKTVTAAGYVLPATGGSVKIKMANRNTVANATLNINSTGAKPLYYNGQRAGVGNTWDTNEIIEVFYDGTKYQAYNVAGCNGDGVFDISAYNLTDGQPTPYEDLAAALGPNGDNVPLSLRKGGMSIKFVHDNKYVQYRLMSDSFNTTPANWQGVETTPTRNSLNFVNSDGILKSTSRLAQLILYNNVLTITYASNVFTVVIPKNTIIRAGNVRYEFGADTTFSFNRTDYSSQNTELFLIDVSDATTPTFSFSKTTLQLTAKQFIIFGISLYKQKITLPDSYYTWNGTSLSNEIINSTNRSCIVSNYGQKIKVTYESLILSVEIPVNTRLYKGGSVYTFAEDTTLTVDHTTLSQLQTLLLIIDGNNTFSFKRGDYTLADGEFIVFGISINTKTLSIPHQQYEWVDYYDDVFSRNAKIILYNKKIDFTKDGTTLRVTIPANTKIFCGQTLIEFDEDTVYEQDWSTINTVNIFCLTINIVTEGLYFQRTRITEPNKYIVFGVSLKTETLTLPDTQYTWNGENETFNNLVGTFAKTCVVSVYNSPIQVTWNNPILSVIFPANTIITKGSNKFTFSEDTTVSVDRTTLSSLNILYLVIDGMNTLSIKKSTYVLQKNEYLVFSISIIEKQISLPNEKYTWNDNVGFINDIIMAKLRQTRIIVDDVKPLNILHFSDVHAWPSALKRVLAFKRSYSSYIDEILHTGDSVRAAYNSADDFSYWGGVDGSENILNVIGNHDSAVKVNDEWDWRHYTDAQCYQMFFADYISNWDVVNPDNHCYYYKDYTTNGRKIRLIVLNDMMTDLTSQTTWLQGVLADAITNNLHVILAAHSRKGGAITPLSRNGRKCSFSFDGSMEGFENYSAACDAVDTFIGNGGTFICWLLGHAHCTSVGYNDTYPNQLQIFADVAYPARFKDDVIRSVGNETEDSFQIVSIDQQAGMIRLIKVGTEYNKYMQHRNIMCYDYINRKMFSDNGDVFVELT